MTLIDARTLGPEPSGIGVYTLNLLRGICVAQPDRPVNVWVRPEVVESLPALVQGSSALRLIERGGSPASLGHWVTGGRAAKRDAAGGVIHVPDVFAPLGWRPWGGPPAVVTLHDVIPLVCKGQLAKSRKQQWAWVWRAWLKMQTARAARVVTVSAFSADDIVKTLGVPREKMVVIHNAVPPREKALEKAPDPFLRNGGEWGGREGEDEPKRGRFVLNVGSRFPYKNVAGLIRAFALMRRDESELSDVRLVVVGPPDARYPGAEDEAARCGVAEAVDFVGYVDHDALGALYRDAALLAVPSLYEGFGLPTAEAMNAGTPVVSSNRASLPEVAGGAALLVDPEDDAAFAAAMARVLNDEVLAAALVQRGSERVTAFGLQAFGAAHLEVYDRVTRG